MKKSNVLILELIFNERQWTFFTPFLNSVSFQAVNKLISEAWAANVNLRNYFLT